MWKDIDIQLRKQTDGDILIMTDEDAIVNSLDNIFTTLQGSRRMLPTFPFATHTLLFEQVDETTAGQLGTNIVEATQKWDDRVEISNVHVNANEDENMYQTSMTFNAKNSVDEAQTVDYILKKQG